MSDSAGKTACNDTDGKSKEGVKIVKEHPLLADVLGESEPATPEFECPVCLQAACFPVQLPCRHIFCFLCVKGVANTSKRCALCRQEIPADFFNEPKLLCEKEIKEKSKTIFDDGYQWFYEGRNGWWQYEERTSVELESRYKKGDKIFELLIAGFLYVIDLENMRQFRRSDQTRRRRIRRDLRTVPGIKGIAGLKFGEEASLRPSGDGGEASSSTSSTVGLGQSSSTSNSSANASNQPFNMSQSIDGQTSIGDDSYLTPPAPNNTPQTPMTPADSQPGSLSGSQEDLAHHFQHLHIINSNSSSRGSPSIDLQDQHFHFNSISSNMPNDGELTDHLDYNQFVSNIPNYDGEGGFLPDEHHDDETQQESIHLNSSNSSAESEPPYFLADDRCPENVQDHSTIGRNDGTDESDHSDINTDLSDPNLPRRRINPLTGCMETYL